LLPQKPRAHADLAFDPDQSGTDQHALSGESKLAGSIDKRYMFLSGWLGGPPLYMEKHGHPMLRARHLPFAIGESERDQWMSCMTRAMVEEGVDIQLREFLLNALFKTADWMRNKAG
jgi:hemoglobin